MSHKRHCSTTIEISMSPMESCNADLTGTKLWLEVEKYFTDLHGPAMGQISHAKDISISPDGTRVAFTGSIWQSMVGVPSSRVCLVDISSESVKIVSRGPNDDKNPKWSRDGKELLFLSDRVSKSSFQLYRMNVDSTGEAQQITSLDGTIEYFSCSRAGEDLLIGLAGMGSDRAGAEGSGMVGVKEAQDSLAEWMPTIEVDHRLSSLRTVWIYRNCTGLVSRINGSASNIWESEWCGPNCLVVLASKMSSEEAWYSAILATIDTEDGAQNVIYESQQQIGHIAVSPSGRNIAFVEALCSDRGLVAGRVMHLDRQSNKVASIDINDIDATQLLWISETELCVAGVRGMDTIVVEVDIMVKSCQTIWKTQDNTGVIYPRIARHGKMIAVVRDSWRRYPEIALVRDGEAETIVSFDHAGASQLRSRLGTGEPLSWLASDGMEIQGMIYLPLKGTKPYPLIINAHGGPIWAYRDTWQGHYPYVAFLTSMGYAVLNPNPRGSTGRGRIFAEAVRGDYGGAEAQDILAGANLLISRGLADPNRLGITGGSHGGYLSVWLVTQTDRFAAAVPRSPTTDYLMHYTTTNIAAYVKLFLDGSPYASDSQFFTRSPIRYVQQCKTPVLQIVGAQDRCTPPGQAIQFHRALLERGVATAVAVYPKEAHGIRQFPAYVDFCCRMLSWFHNYMPASIPQ